MQDERGRPVDPLKVHFRELTLVRRDEHGASHLLLDGKRHVVTKDRDPFQEHELVPLVESPELAALRRRYLGRRVWTYGDLSAWREALRPRTSASSGVKPGRSLKIARIYQIAKVPIDFSKNGSWGKGLDLQGRYKPRDYGDESPFLLVYDLPDLRLTSWSGSDLWSKEDERRAEDPRSYGLPYNVFVGSWFFDRLFSLRPPTPETARAIRRVEARSRAGEDSLLGLTHVQVAWAFGWPMARKPISQLLKEPTWTYGDMYRVVFKKGKAASFHQSMPH
jgi:hypothetical protein